MLLATAPQAAPLDASLTAPFEAGEAGPSCLLLHGFTGSPWDLRPLGDALAGRGFHVRAPRLPGHGTTPQALASVGRLDWEVAAEEALWALRDRAPVHVSGLSMGALLAVLLAARHPKQVRSLALLAPAMDFLDPAMRLARRLRGVRPLSMVPAWVRKTGTDIELPEARAAAPVLPAIPTPKLWDVWDLQDAARAALTHVRCPTLVVAARHDHVVSVKGAQALVQALPRATLTRFVVVEEGFHILPRDRAAKLVCEEVAGHFERAR